MEEISHFVFKLHSNVNSKWDIFQIFVVISEYLNFIVAVGVSVNCKVALVWGSNFKIGFFHQCQETSHI